MIFKNTGHPVADHDLLGGCIPLQKAPRPTQPEDKWKNSTKNQEMEKFSKKAGKMAKQ